MRKAAAVLILTLVTSWAWASTKIYRDRDVFVKETEPNVTVKLTGVPDYTPAPFASEGVLFTQGLVQSVAVGLTSSFWFPGVDSSPEFLVGPLVVATFPNDANASGVDFTCFACDGSPNDSSMNWTLLSSSGSVVDSGSTIYDFSSWNYSYTPFLGITSEIPFRSIVLSRTGISQEGLMGNWFAYHLRYVSVPPNKALLLPAAVRAHGLFNTYFTTDLWVSNGSNSTLTVKVDFLRAGGYDNTTPAETNTLFLGAHETRVVADALGTLFSVSDQYGPLRFSATGEGADQFVVGSRTSCILNGQRATYGLSVDAREANVSDTSPLHLVGLPQNAVYRTNIGVINLGSGDAEFALTLFDSAGSVLGTADGSLPPLGATQSSLISLFQSALGLEASRDGLAVVVSTKNGSALAAYATSIDNTTGDGTFINGLHATQGASSGTTYLPESNTVTGMFGTRWASRLAIRNIDPQQAITLSFSLQVPDSDNRGITPVTRVVNKGATLLISNVIQNLFGLKTGNYGALRVDWISSGGRAPVFSSQFM